MNPSDNSLLTSAWNNPCYNDEYPVIKKDAMNNSQRYIFTFLQAIIDNEDIFVLAF